MSTTLETWQLSSFYNSAKFKELHPYAIRAYCSPKGEPLPSKPEWILWKSYPTQEKCEQACKDLVLAYQNHPQAWTFSCALIQRSPDPAPSCCCRC